MQTSSHRGHPRQGHLALAVVRMLIASYFLASAGLIKNADGATFLSEILPPVPAEALATSIFYGTGFALMIGRFMREAALVLAVFIFWSSFGASLELGFGGAQLMDLWRDMALVGAVLLIGLTQPRGEGRLRLPFGQAKQPRRIAPGSVVVRRRDRPVPLREAPPPTPEPDDDIDNIFADLSAA